MISTMIDIICFDCKKPMGQKPGIPGPPTSSLCPECNAKWYATLEERRQNRADDEQYAMYEEQQYWAAANNAWVKADKKCRVCDTPLTLDEFEQRYCPKCSVEEIPF